MGRGKGSEIKRDYSPLKLELLEIKLRNAGIDIKDTTHADIERMIGVIYTTASIYKRELWSIHKKRQKTRNK